MYKPFHLKSAANPSPSPKMKFSWENQISQCRSILKHAQQTTINITCDWLMYYSNFDNTGKMQSIWSKPNRSQEQEPNKKFDQSASLPRLYSEMKANRWRENWIYQEHGNAKSNKRGIKCAFWLVIKIRLKVPKFLADFSGHRKPWIWWVLQAFQQGFKWKNKTSRASTPNHVNPAFIGHWKPWNLVGSQNFQQGFDCKNKKMKKGAHQMMKVSKPIFH